MNRFFLLVCVCLMAFTTTADAQIRAERGRKFDLGVAAIRGGQSMPRQSRSANAQADTTTHRFLVTVSDVDAAADSIALLGGEVRVVGENVLSVTIPSDHLESLTDLKSVSHIEASRQLRPLMSTARAMTRADSVQGGIGLETPYTGEGVIIGFIDQSFQYRHRAFLDSEGNSRVLAVWNRYAKDNATTTIPSGSDGITGLGGHATHVASIAAGSVVNGNSYYGMAPEADIIMVPSNFDTDEILEDAQWIKSLAEQEGKPWIINMSFGANCGPHDGTTTYEQAMNSLCDSGGLMVAAMGNSGGDAAHVSYTFSAADETVYLLASNSTTYNMNYLDLWSTMADSTRHLEVDVVVYNAQTKTFTTLSEQQLNRVGYVGGEINANNSKEHYLTYVTLSSLATLVGQRSTSNLYFGFKVTSLDANVGFHAWTESGYGEFVTVDGYGLAGDDEYMVSQGSASILRAIGVAAYNGKSSWQSMSGTTYRYTGYTTSGELADYSSPGPSLGSDMKPSIAAPGTTITAALNRYDGPSNYSTIQKTDRYVVMAVDSSGDSLSYNTASTTASHFYGVKQGTSMSCPAVSGILALWLQANPSLTPEDVVDIFEATAIHDEYTGGTTGDWTVEAGYGKIDAYAGLKKALEMLTASRGDATMTSDNPVTLSMSADKWRILFNIATTDVTVSLYGIDGSEVSRTTLGEVYAGQEEVVDFATYMAGTYILRIVTPGAIVTRKIVVSH